eukprot:1157110-Pelagomonas_calceolata.AAC.7
MSKQGQRSRITQKRKGWHRSKAGSQVEGRITGGRQDHRSKVGSQVQGRITGQRQDHRSKAGSQVEGRITGRRQDHRSKVGSQVKGRITGRRQDHRSKAGSQVEGRITGPRHTWIAPSDPSVLPALTCTWCAALLWKPRALGIRQKMHTHMDWKRSTAEYSHELGAQHS